jgi:hypothetical protein
MNYVTIAVEIIIISVRTNNFYIRKHKNKQGQQKYSSLLVNKFNR